MKKFTIHGSAKGKNDFDQRPVAHIWATDEDDALRQGELITRMNPLLKEHLGDELRAQEHQS